MKATVPSTSKRIADLRKQAQAQAAAELAAEAKQREVKATEPEVAFKPTKTARARKPKVDPPEPTSPAPAAAKRPKGEITEADRVALKAKYPLVDESTLELVSVGDNLWKRRVHTQLECGHETDLFTSDLFQVKRCDECRKAAKRTGKAGITRPPAEPEVNTQVKRARSTMKRKAAKAKAEGITPAPVQFKGGKVADRPATIPTKRTPKVKADEPTSVKIERSGKSGTGLH